MASRSIFQAKMEKLQNEIIDMGTVTADMIRLSMEALVERNNEKVKRVLELEDFVDEMYNKLESKCARLIATQAPVARDLRIISSALSDVERIADYSVDIAFVAKKLLKKEPIKPYKDFPKMADLDVQMLNLVLSAYKKMDLEACYAVGKMDDEVDKLYKKSFKELVNLMKESPENVERAVNLVLVGRYLERIGDHITNVAERIVYIETGVLSNLKSLQS